MENEKAQAQQDAADANDKYWEHIAERDQHDPESNEWELQNALANAWKNERDDATDRAQNWQDQIDSYRACNPCTCNQEPTQEPNSEPTQEPNSEPTQEPNSEPTQEPNSEPTHEPNSEPAQEPNSEPTQEPSSGPTQEPVQ